MPRTLLPILARTVPAVLSECPELLDNAAGGQREARTRLAIIPSVIGNDREVARLSKNDADIGTMLRCYDISDNDAILEATSSRSGLVASGRSSAFEGKRPWIERNSSRRACERHPGPTRERSEDVGANAQLGALSSASRRWIKPPPAFLGSEMSIRSY